ncbi:MAG: TolC family protein [Rhodothermales bacterium]
MTTIHRLVIIVAAGVILAHAVQGQEAPLPSTLGVTEAVELAQERNPRIQELRSTVAAKSNERWLHLGIHAPRITYFREGIPTVAAGGFAEQRWAASQSIAFPLKSYYDYRRTGTELEAMDVNLDAARAGLKAAVKTAYTDVLYAQELMHLRDQELTLADRLVAAAQVRVEVGEASELEQMKADLEHAEAQSRRRDAQRELEAARYRLFREIGIDPEDQTYQMVFPDTLVDVEIHITQEEVMARVSRLPEVLAADLFVEAAEMERASARVSILPDVIVDVYRQDYGTGYDRYGVQVGLQLPLWLFGEYRGRVRQADAEERAASWRRESVELDLKEQAELAWHGYVASRTTMERFRTSVQERADELLRLTLVGYQLGELDLVTLLDTQRTYLAGQERFYDALRDYYKQLIVLERILGDEFVYVGDSETATSTERNIE